MNRMILGGALALAVGIPGMMAQPKPKSKSESEALQAMFAAQTADARIAAAENVLGKFADTDFKSIALYLEAASYEQKGDYEHAIVFGERALEADPKDYEAMLVLAREYAGHTKEFDFDREDKLAKVDKYAKGALELIKTAPKPNPNVTDGQWSAAKKDFEGQAHEALGLAALARKKPDVAETEFKVALDGEDKPDPGVMVRLGMAYSQQGKYDDAIATFDKVMAMPDIPTQFKQFAQAERVRSLQKKNGTAKPAAATPANGTTPANTTAPANTTTPANPAPAEEGKKP
jgi:tetratricopeptide (TPR) repeat protein